MVCVLRKETWVIYNCFIINIAVFSRTDLMIVKLPISNSIFRVFSKDEIYILIYSVELQHHI